MGKLFPLSPALVSKPWAGGHLEGFANSAIRQIGEAVLYSLLPHYAVQVWDGEVSSNAWEFSVKLPFMVKLLSTKDPLSLQNHPADEDIEKLGLSGCGKTECWFILEAEEKAKIYLGLKDGFGREILSELGSYENPLSFFNAFSPRKGDLYFLPAGMVHGTEGRILFYEIQQNSDYTFRIYDFNRGRELHLTQAKEVYRSHKPLVLHDQSYFACKYFRFWAHYLKKNEVFSHEAPYPELITWVGKEAILSAGGIEKNIPFGSSFLATKAATYQIQALSEGYLIRSSA